MIYEPGDSLGQGINHKAIERLTRVDATACNLLKSDICMPNAGTKIQFKKWTQMITSYSFSWKQPAEVVCHKMFHFAE